ncbi:MAG: polyprenyl synthetase family protein [archaeon]|nr:polyprenyl synthetase family protein [archaeon]
MEFQKILEADREKINTALKDYLEKKREELEHLGELVDKEYEIMTNYLLGNGKRLRSILTVQAFNAVNGKHNEDIFFPSLSVEFFHNASLILDDVMDEDAERRGIKSSHEILLKWFNERYGKNKYNGKLYKDCASRFAVSLSTIGTNILFSFGANTIIESSFDNETKLKALSIYEKTYREVNLGQLLDILFEYKKDITEQQYFEMAKRKTGCLLAGALTIGATLGNAEQKQIDTLTDYALSSATTFQIQDDIMDLLPEYHKGREIGSDIRKGKTTLVLIHAMQKADEKQKKLLKEVVGKNNASQEEINEAIEVFHKTDSINYARNYAKQKIEEGKQALQKNNNLFSKEGKEFFENFAEYVINRKV